MLKLKSKSVGAPGGFSYFQAETQRRMQNYSWPSLLTTIAEHRRGHQLSLEPGWEDEVEGEVCLGLGEDWCFDPTDPQPFRSELQKVGRKLWAVLHAKGLQLTEGRLTATESTALSVWLSRWEDGIPNWGGCDCKNFYLELKAQTPPNFDSGAGFLLWTQCIHDAVNLKLGKPLFLGQ